MADDFFPSQNGSWPRPPFAAVGQRSLAEPARPHGCSWRFFKHIGNGRRRARTADDVQEIDRPPSWGLIQKRSSRSNRLCTMMTHQDAEAVVFRRSTKLELMHPFSIESTPRLVRNLVFFSRVCVRVRSRSDTTFVARQRISEERSRSTSWNAATTLMATVPKLEQNDRKGRCRTLV